MASESAQSVKMISQGLHAVIGVCLLESAGSLALRPIKCWRSRSLTLFRLILQTDIIPVFVLLWDKIIYA